MSVFGKKDNFEKDLSKAENEAITSIIDTSVVITGEISFKGKARIDGHIVGNIKGEHLILSKTGKIEGDIEVSSFICHGNMTGNAKANIVTLRKECSIHGKVHAQSLTVEPGALVDGEIKAATKDLKASYNQKDLSATKSAASSAAS